MRGPACILMVDDDDDFAAGIRLILESRGYEFHRAATFPEGLAMLAKVRPHLIILDVVIGNKAEGFSFARTLRTDASLSDFASVPILTMTGMRSQTKFSFPEPPHQAVYTAGDEFLEKPVEPRVLLKTVAALLGGKR
ncbi:MAG: response regulator [Elusimicrobia bacterium]|nr:response regulator [Elusimicrobiota bacterium]